MAVENTGETPHFDKLKQRLPEKEDTLVRSPSPEGYLGWLDAGIDGVDAMWLQNRFRSGAEGPAEDEHKAQLRRLAQFRGSEN
jgi:hypothetical protein